MIIRNLQNEAIVKLANIVANDLGMRPLDEKSLIKALRINPPNPAIINSVNAQLWVDRYYIAYSLKTDRLVHYVYIAQKHAKEELHDLPKRILKCSNKAESDMLRDISQQLNIAVNNEKPFYIAFKYKCRMEKASVVEM